MESPDEIKEELPENFSITSDAMEALLSFDSERISRIIDFIPNVTDETKVVTEIVEQAASREASKDTKTSPVHPKSQDVKSGEKSDAVEKLLDEDYKDIDSVRDEIIVSKDELTPELERAGEAEINVLTDITDSSESVNDVSNYRSLFNDRYERISEMLSDRIPSNMDIGVFQTLSDGTDVNFTGIIREKYKSQSGNPMLNIEDDTGEVSVVVSDDEMHETCEKIFTDEVIGIIGSTFANGDLVGADEIYFPDIAKTNSPTTANRSVKAAFIGDVHMGAKTFDKTRWKKFIKWMRVQENIEYLFVAGDIVEGIGVYPGQDSDIELVDASEQYQLFAESLQQLPNSVEIVICTGNHDMTRLAEPQPQIQDRYQEHFADNVTFVGNPSYVEIEGGTTVLLYHGMSINTFTDDVPDEEVIVDNPEKTMELMLKKRVMIPEYGRHARVAPEPVDHSVIDTIPDIYHTGHVHTFGESTYNSIKLFNTGTWQEQTAHQERLNIVPDLGNVPVVDLQNWTTNTFTL